MKTMFRRDVVVLLASDGVMCAITGVSWVLQRLVFAGYIDWDRSGWIIQNVSEYHTLKADRFSQSTRSGSRPSSAAS